MLRINKASRTKIGILFLLFVALLFVVGLAFFVGTQPNYQGWTFDNDSVFWEKEGVGRIKVYPHTIFGSQNVTVEVTSWYNETTFIDVALCFDRDISKPESAWVWSNYSHQGNPIFGDVVYSKDCAGVVDVNYGFLNSSWGWCNDSICLGLGNASCYWEHRFDDYKFNESGVRIFWNETEQIGFEEVWFKDWKEFKEFSHQRFFGKECYYVKDVKFEPQQSRVLNTYIDVRGMSGIHKYFVAFKPSVLSLQQALNNNLLLLLDPWSQAEQDFDLNVSFCSATACVSPNIDLNDTSVGVTLAKGISTSATMTDTTFDETTLIQDVWLRFRYTGQINLDGTWDIALKSDDGLTTYCTKQITQCDVVCDVYTEFNLTGATNCEDWTKSKLDDLNISILNNDAGAGKTGDVTFLDIFIEDAWSNATLYNDTMDSWTDINTSVTTAIFENGSSKLQLNITFDDGFVGTTINASRYTNSSTGVTQNDVLQVYAQTINSWGAVWWMTLNTLYFNRTKGLTMEFNFTTINNTASGSNHMPGFFPMSGAVTASSIIHGWYTGGNQLLWREGAVSGPTLSCYGAGSYDVPGEGIMYTIKIILNASGASYYAKNVTGGHEWRSCGDTGGTTTSPMRIGITTYAADIDYDSLKVYYGYKENSTYQSKIINSSVSVDKVRCWVSATIPSGTGIHYQVFDGSHNNIQDISCNSTGILNDITDMTGIGYNISLSQKATTNTPQINWFAIEILEVAGDTTKPTWEHLTNNASTVTRTNGNVSFGINLSDETGLSAFILMSNKTGGSLANETTVMISGIPKKFTANYSVIVTATSGVSVCGAFWFNDTSNNINVSSWSCFKVIYNDSVRPVVFLTLPNATENFLNLNNTFTINHTARVSDNWNLTNVSLWHNITGVWVRNQTTNFPASNNSNFSFTINIFKNTTYIWNFIAYDNSSNQGTASANRTVTTTTYSPPPDTTAPTYSLNSTSTTEAGASTEFSLYWTDDTNLSGYTFLFCNGTWDGSTCSGGYVQRPYNWTNNTNSNPSNAVDLSANDTTTAATLVQIGSYAWANYSFNISSPTAVLFVTFNSTYSSGTAPGNGLSLYNFTTNAWVLFVGGFTTIPGLSLRTNSTTVSKAGGTISSTGEVRLKVVSATGGTGNVVIYLWDTYIYEAFNDRTVGLFSGTGNWSNVTKTANSTVGANISWCVYANDTSNNWNTTSCDTPFSYITTSTADSTKPTWEHLTNNASIVTRTNGNVSFGINLSDDIGLSGFILMSNKTGGSLANETTVMISGTPKKFTANYSVIVTATSGVSVCGAFWFNDTSNNINVSSWSCFKVIYNDSVRPVVFLTLPNTTENFLNLNNTFTINHTARVSDNWNLTNVSLWHNITGVWVRNQTTNFPASNNSNFSFTINIFKNTTYIWNFIAYDNSSNQGTASANRTVTTTTYSPAPPDFNPTWKDLTNNASTVTRTNGNVSFGVNLTDDVGLSAFILVSNKTGGSLANETTVMISGTPTKFTANYSVIVTAVHTSVCGAFWFNDTSNNINISDWSCFYIANSPPTHSTPMINSSVGTNYTNETIQCFNQSFADADNDGLVSWYRWFNDSGLISGQTTSSIASSITIKHWNYTCEVTPDDTYNNGTKLNSTSLKIRNYPPTFDESLPDQTVATGSSLYLDANASDIDLDTISWAVNDSRLSIDSNGVITDSPVVGDIGIHTINVSANDGETNVSDVFVYTVTDGIVPTWSNNKSNASGVKVGQWAYFNITLNDDVQGSYYLFSFSNSTSWSNSSWISWTTPKEVTQILQNNATQGKTLSWYWRFNDSSNNFNETNTWSVTVADTSPTTPTTLSPSSGNITSNTQQLTCLGSSDADSDPVRYEFYGDTSSTPTTLLQNTTSTTYDWAFTSGNTYYFRCRAHDGNSTSGYTSTNYLYVDYMTPTIPSITNNGSNARTGWVVNWTGTVSDDRQLAKYRLETNDSGTWTNESLQSTSGTTTNFDLKKTVTATRGKYICGRVWVNDTSSNANESNNSCFTVQNTAPTHSTPIINSSVATNYTNETLQCFNQSFTDADNDGLTANYRWFNDSGLISGQTTSTLGNSITIKHWNYTCEVTPNDGYDDGTSLNSTALKVLNAVPTHTAPVINTSSATNYTNETVQCFNQSFADIDNDGLTANYRWFNDSGLISGQTTSSIASSITIKHWNYTCEVRPYDGEQYGSRLNSTSLEIRNYPPTFDESLPDQSVSTGSSLYLDANASDIDLDTISWAVNDSRLSIDSSGIITDAPIETDVGTHIINVSANDKETNTSTTFTYSVTDATTPTWKDLTNNASTITRTNGNVSFGINLSDGVGLSAFILMSNKTGGALANESTVMISGIPKKFTANYSVIVTATSGVSVCGAFWFNDTNNNINVSSWSCFKVIYSDSISPSVFLTLPNATENFLNLNNTFTINHTARVSDNWNLTTINFWHNITGTWQINQTISNPAYNQSNVSFTIDIFANTTYIWNFEAIDNSSNQATGSANRTVTTTTYSPAPPDFNPTWEDLTNNASTITYTNGNVSFGINLSDDIGLSAFILMTNKTGGALTNETTVMISGTPTKFTANYSIITTTVHTSICGAFWFNDTSNNINVSDFSCFYVQNSPPTTPTVISPSNNFINKTINIEYSSSDADSDIIWYSVYINNTLNRTTNTNISDWQAGDGSYSLQVNAYDNTTYSANSTTTTFTKDTIAPTINQIYPINNSNISSIEISVKFNFSDNLANSAYCELWGNFSNIWALNQTNTSVTTNTNTNFSIIVLSETVYLYNIQCNDTATNWGFGNNLTFTTDISPPIISNINNVSTTTQITINWSTNEPANSSATCSNITEHRNASSSLTKIHRLTITNLTPNKIYLCNVTNYDILTQGNTSNNHFFPTKSEIVTQRVGGPPSESLITKYSLTTKILNDYLWAGEIIQVNTTLTSESNRPQNVLIHYDNGFTSFSILKYINPQETLNWIEYINTNPDTTGTNSLTISLLNIDTPPNIETYSTIGKKDFMKMLLVPTNFMKNLFEGRITIWHITIGLLALSATYLIIDRVYLKRKKKETTL